MGFIKDLVSPESRAWESFYRNRFQHDKSVRSTHGANCTGGCSWNVHVKNGVVVWETQALDYPKLSGEIPPYEPRGCQKGASFSWYIYSPLRVKFPLIRGALLDLYRSEKAANGGDPVKAWEALQGNKEKRARYQRARGKGGFRRISWDEILEIIAASNIYTVKKYGPDRLIGFSPIPAMSMMSYAAGARYLQLMGGVSLSFYDWYCDLPNAFPEIFGEQTDVCESADWFNSKFVAITGANLGMTRVPDAHFFAEARHNGTKSVVFAPDFNATSKFADQWVPLHPGQDGALWLAVTHLLLKEYHHEKKTPYFLEYAKKYTDGPFLVELAGEGGAVKPGKFVRANRLSKYKDAENGDWKFLNLDANTLEPVMPKGSVGHRWDKAGGKWNMKFEDGLTDAPYEPLLTFLEKNEGLMDVEFTEFAGDKKAVRSVPYRKLRAADGSVIAVTTVYDLLMAQYGVSRGLGGAYPASYDDESAAYTPAWQEKFTGVSRETVIKFAREWSETAAATNGKCMIIIGAGVNHYFHSNLIYRAGITALMMSGCVGVNGGGINHYVGQEKLAPMDSWSALMSGKDWQNAARLQQGTLWHYINSDQWRYDAGQKNYNRSHGGAAADIHSADFVVKAVKNGWMPFYPQYGESNFDIVKGARAAGAETEEAMRSKIVERLKSKDLAYAVSDPDNEANFPRVWFIWRGNALMSSAKGHEYMLKHYLGTHNNTVAKESAKDEVKEINWFDLAPQGKMDLVVDINFRMDTSALYSDIVLPAASWYEKSDINSTDMHSFLHPLAAAIPPVWEAKSDWEIFRSIAAKVSELAVKHLPGTYTDAVNLPLMHDTVDELSQPAMLDWSKGDCEPVPGKSMHKIVFVDREYTKIHDKFTTLGPNIKKTGLGAHGNSYDCSDEYDKLLLDKTHTRTIGGVEYPSLYEDVEAINAVLALSTLTNGKLTVRAYANMEKKTGLKLADLAEGTREVFIRYEDLQSQPRRYNTSPLWSGLMNDGRPYAAFTYNTERLVPFRTLTGREHLYLDHDGYLLYGENLPTFKLSPTPEQYGDLVNTPNDGKAKMLNVLTPHGKWAIHSTYSDNLRMLSLNRGIEPCWLSPGDAESLGIQDNDWVEVYNDHGVYSTRANVSARIPKGVCVIYHSPERTYSTPKSNIRGGKRSGGHNSLCRTRLKPSLMIGGYAQFTYHFNYWGPVGVNRDTHVLVRKMDKVEL